MALMLGRCPPGKMCSFMKSGEAQYAAYLESGIVMTYTARLQRYTAGCCRALTDGGNRKTFTVASFSVAFIQQLLCGMEKPELATWWRSLVAIAWCVV